MLGLLVAMAALAGAGRTAAAEPPPPTISWVGAVSGLWNNPLNWNPARVPLDTDHVSINVTTNATVTLNISTTVASLALGAESGSVTQRLVVNAGAGLTVNTGSVVRARGELILSNGDNLGLAGAGLLEFRGLLDWTGGRLYGAYSIAPGGRALLRGGTYMRLSSGNGVTPAVFTNAGTLTWLGGQRLFAYDNSQIVNLGRWELASDGLAQEHCCSGAGATFLNRGTLIKVAGAGTTTMQSFTLLNEGTVAADTGTLRFPNTVASEWRDGGQVAGAGTVLLENGTATLAGRTSLNGVWFWTGDNLEIYGQGTLAGPVPLEWDAGQVRGKLTVASDGAINLRGGNYCRLSSDDPAIPAVLTNRGTIRWLGGQRLVVYYGAQIYNEGTWQFAADGLALEHCCGGDWGTFHNSGVLAKTGGTGTTRTTSITMRNLGTVNAAAGVLQIESSSIWEHGGQLTGPGQILLSGGNATLAGTTTLGASWQWIGANVYGTGVVSGPQPLVWRTGRLYGNLSIALGAQLQFTGEYFPILAGTDAVTPAVITNQGAVTWNGGYPLYAGQGSRIYNLGAWRCTADGTALDFSGGGDWMTFHNSGTFTKSGGLGETAINSCVFTNRSVVSAASGTVRFSASSIWENGSQIAGGGRVMMSPGNVTLAGSIVLNGSWQWSSVNVSGAGTITGPTPLVWRTGRLYGQLTVSPGAQLDFTGEYYPILAASDVATPAILTNRGTVTWNGGYPLYGGQGSRVYNFGSWRCTADGTALDYSGGADLMSFLNLGSFSKSGGANETYISTSIFSNRANVNVASGTLRYGSSSIWETGGEITGSGRVWMNPGTVTLNGRTTLNASWQWTGVSVYGTGVVSGSVPMTWRTGRLFGNLTVDPGAGLDFTGEYYPLLAGIDATNVAVFTNRGTVTWPGGYPLYAGLGAQIYNLGEWRVSGQGTALDFSGGGNWATLHNLGTVRKVNLTESVFDQISIDNQGRITAENGQLRLNNPPATSGVFHFPVRGPVPYTNYGVVRVNGTYPIAATLRVEFADGYSPARGDFFDLLTGQNLVGNFAALELPTRPADEGWTVDYSPPLARLRLTDRCLADGLMGWWAGDGTFEDQTTAYPGGLIGNVSFAPGYIGQAFSFDGAGDGVNLGSWTPNARWTLQAWVNLRSLQASRRAILGGLDNCRDWALTATDGYLGLTYRQPGGCTTTLTNTARAATNVWYHLAGTFDGQSVAFYQNGTLIGTAPAEPNYVATPGPRIGTATYNLSAESFDGLVDEATIHNRPLSGAEIAGSYNNGPAGRCAQIGLGILAFIPQGLVTTDVTNLTVRFNQSFRTNTFTTADIVLSGPNGPVPSAGFSIAPLTPFDGRTFIVTVPRLTNEGVYSITIGPNIETLAGQPMPLPYTASFNLDKAAPVVIAFTPTSPVTNQTSLVEATFSEAMSGASAQAADLVITGPGTAVATAVSQTASNQFRFTLSRPLSQGAQTIVLSGINDLAGNVMKPYTNVITVQNPDLAPGIVASPAIALAGQSATLVYSVTNLGNVLAPGSWRTDISMSTNAAGANPVLLGTAIITNVIAPGAVLTLTQSLVFPPGLAGARFLGIRVDATDVLVESSESNNVAWAASSTSVSAPDLAALALTAPASAARGESINVTWIRTNRGSAATFVAGQDRLFLSANPNTSAGAYLLATVPGALLGPGQSLARTQSVVLPLSATVPAGGYYLLVAVDSPDAQAEADEGNNLASRPLNLNDPPLPDLTFAEVSLPATLIPDASMQARWTVTNAGSLGLTNVAWRERVMFSNSVAGLFTLADVVVTNSLAVAQSLSRTQALVYPASLPAEPGWIRIILDFANEVIEANEANNVATSDSPADVMPHLGITLDPSTLEEGPGLSIATVRRNGRTNETVVVALTNNWPARLAMPSQLVLTAGVAQAQFSVGYPANAIPEGQRMVRIGTTAENYDTDYALLSLVDGSQPALTLTLATNRLREGLTTSATVSRGASTAEPLEVLLSVVDPLSLNVPFSIVIPSNQAALTFTVLAPDDTFFNGSRTNQVRAAALGHADATADVVVADDDLPAITLELTPSMVAENAGPQAASLSIRLSGPAPRNVVLDLESSDPTRARVPAAASVPAGQTVAAVPVEVIDNVGFGSNAPVQFRGLIHEANSYQYIGQTAPVTLTIVDDEGPSLTVRLDRDLVDEGLAVAAQGTVSRNGATTAPLVVTLQSSDPTEATVPPSVTIPAGQAQAAFNIASIADGLTDGAQRAVILATAAGFTPGSATLTVSDLDLPDYRVVNVSGPATALAESTFNVSYRVQNQGRTPGGSNLLTKVYLRTDPLAFGGILVGSYTLPSPLPPGQFFEQSLQGRFPDRVGRYYLVVQTDADGHIAEGLEDNNLLVSAPIELTAPWSATAQTSVTRAPAGTPIPITGRATRPGGTPVASALVSIHVMHAGFLRTLAAFTDATGDFAATFQPLAGEAGFYEIAAGHPGVATLPAQDSFQLLGMALHPAGQRIEIKEGETAQGGFVVSNLSAQPITGVAARVLSGPPGWSTTLTFTSQELPAGGTAGLLYSIAPNSTGIGTIVVQVTADGGVTNYHTLTLAVAPLTARLVAEPTSLFAGMVRGGQTVVNFVVHNEGGLASGLVNISLPNADWLRVASPNPMPSLPPGGSNVVTLLLSPPADLELVPFDGTLQLVSTTASLNVPFQFRALSSAQGDLRVSVVDELTFYAQGGPLVSNALVVLRDPQTHQAVTNAVTDANGVASFASLPEAYYEVEVSAEKHTSHRGNTFLTAGKTNELEIFISRTLVQYIWTVVPTEVEDRTRITIETEFETVVPLPVITVEPAYLDLADLPEPEAQVEFRITNHGLVAAKNVGLELPGDGAVNFATVATALGDLPAQSSITVPVRITFPTATGGGGGFAPASASAGTGGGGPINVTRDRCYYYVKEKHEIPCGKRTNTYYTVSAVRDSKASGCSGGGGPGGSASGQGPLFNGGPLSPYGVAAGGGSGVYVAPRTVPPPDEKCGCEGFVPTCGELSGGVSVPPIKILGGTEASVKVSGTGKLCTCCDDDGKGFTKEFSGSIEGSAKIAIPITTPDPSIEWEENGYKFEAAMHLGGLVLELSPKITGQVQYSEECHGKNPKKCINLIASAEGELNATLGPEVSVSQNGRAVGKFGGTAKIYAKTGMSTKLTDCNGVTELKSCINPITVGFALTLAGPGFTEVSHNTSIDLTQEDCSGNLLPPSGGGGGGSSNLEESMSERLNEIMQPIFEKMLQELQQQYGLRNLQPAAAPAQSLVVPPAPSGNGGGGEFRPASGGQVCARVRLRIDQDLVMTRQAFDATLELINRDPVTPLDHVAVQVQVFDANGHDVSELFGQRPPAVFGLGAVDGTGHVAPDSTGRASFILVPTRDAAPQQPTVYFVGGTLAYHLGDLTIEIPLTPAPITVYPDPRLKIQYFHQRDVLADDPFTREIIEPSIPYSLAVMIKNNGYGEAKNVRLISGQPQIIENERGLLIDFKIIATEVAGVGLTPALTADFGPIPPGQTKIGRWLMTSTLQGLFINYSATFEHLDSLGKTNLSLVDEVTIHEMIRQVHAAGAFEDNKPDFLVNDVADPDDLPDHLYLSDGSTNDVAVVRSAFSDGAPTPDDLSVSLTTPMPAGWAYLRVPDPANGAYRLARVVRSDGRIVSVDTNAWQTDRTFIGRTQRPIRENLLHLLDYDSTGRYTLIYEPLPATDFTPPNSSVAALPTYSTAQIPVSWSGTDSGGGAVAGYDIYVAENRGPFIPWLQGVSQQAAIYEGVGGRLYEFYSIATDTAGNRESPPLYADTQTTVTLSNNPPTLALVAPAAVNEGETVVITANATDPEMPRQSLLFTLLAGPPGAILNPATGRIEWVTGEGNGPGTNLFRVSARDNGLPPLSVTSQVSVIVREVNTAPILAALANRTINEGAVLAITNTVYDLDLPVQRLSFQLGPNAPSGATIDAQTGVFRWRPSQTQGGTTNVISIIVTDDGVPTLSATQRVAIVVRDTQADFRLALGRTHVLRGEDGAISVQLTSGLELTNLQFVVNQPVTALTNLSLTPTAPELGSATLTPTAPNRAQITLLPGVGQSFQGDSTLASLRFTALPAGPSLVLSLLVTNLEARRADGLLVANPSAVPGQVVVIGDRPVLEARTAPAGEHRLTLYGRPGKAYELQGLGGLESTTWQALQHIPMVQSAQDITRLSPTNLFYRAMEYSPAAAQLELGGASPGADGNGGAGLESMPGEWFMLYGRAGSTYSIESADRPDANAGWRLLQTVPLTNSFQAVPVPIKREGMEFFRARTP